MPDLQHYTEYANTYTNEFTSKENDNFDQHCKDFTFTSESIVKDHEYADQHNNEYSKVSGGIDQQCIDFTITSTCTFQASENIDQLSKKNDSSDDVTITSTSTSKVQTSENIDQLSKHNDSSDYSTITSTNTSKDSEGIGVRSFQVTGPLFVVQHFTANTNNDNLDHLNESSDAESCESDELFDRWELIRGLIEKLPEASGEEILQEFLDAKCLNEEDFDVELLWGMTALRSWGYVFPDE